MVDVKTLETKTKSLKSLIVKPLKVDEKGKVHAFVAMYNRLGIGSRMSQGVKEINILWDQSSTKRPKGYWVLGDLFNNEGDVGASCFVSDEYLDITLKDQKELDKADWRNVCEELAK